jgi:hypothetical protein
MNAQVKDFLVGLTFCVGGTLLAVNPMSLANATDAENMNNVQVLANMTPTERFVSNVAYCKAFIAAQDIGADSATADFAAALNEAVHSNGDDATRTFSTIREKCDTAA